MADKHEAIKRLLDRIKSLAENLIDQTTGDYQADAQYIYTVASSAKQKIEMDDDDRAKEDSIKL